MSKSTPTAKPATKLAAKPMAKLATKPMAKRASPLKLTIGKIVGYTSRTHTGRGKIVKLYNGFTGSWVTIDDKARAREVTVRPSQVTA